MLRITWSCIVLVCCSFTLHALNLNATSSSSSSSKILVHPHQHPDPQAVVHDVNRRVNESVTRRQLLVVQVRDQCLTGNPIDDCWRCDPNWELNREHLADCAIGFGREALGGRGGNVYVVTDPSDPDPENPPPGTLRYGVVQAGPLWIIFSGNMVIKLRYELLISSFKTIDGRGANVHITGLGCLIIYDVTNIIIHNVHIHHCKPSGNAKIRISPTQVTERGRSDGDGISVLASSKIWIDHCFLSYCTDGLIDVTEGSTAVTLSNNMFAHHDKVMLLGHSDDFTADSGMQVTVAFNHFGDDLKERMPRCRFGYFHVVNNDYTQWGMYAVGGSSHPTINSQGNRYLAPQDNNNKEVTKRMDTDESEWRKWNWRSEGDLMVNGAFFVTSGADMSPQYAEASSMSPLSASYIDQLTATAGVLVEQRSHRFTQICHCLPHRKYKDEFYANLRIHVWIMLLLGDHLSKYFNAMKTFSSLSMVKSFMLLFLWIGLRTKSIHPSIHLVPFSASAFSVCTTRAIIVILISFAGLCFFCLLSRSDAGTVTNPSSGGGIVTNPAAPGSSGGGVVTNPAAPGSSGGTVTNPVSSGGDGSSGYPGQGSTGTITGTSCWYTDNGIDYGSIYNSEARTPLVPMTSVILSVIAIVAFLHRTCS